MQMGLSLPNLRMLLAAVAEEAAQHSLVVGELPPMPHDQVLFKGPRCGARQIPRKQSFVKTQRDRENLDLEILQSPILA